MKPIAWSDEVNFMSQRNRLHWHLQVDALKSPTFIRHHPYCRQQSAVHAPCLSATVLS